MKMYILRWNPTFSMKYEDHLQGMELLKEQQIDSNWSIYDYEDLEEGDIFIFNQVGTGEEDGIAGFGTFTSEPYAAGNWKENDHTNRFYADFNMECLLDRRGGNIFSAEEMEKAFPEIDWHKGHAGVLVPEAIQEELILYLMRKTMWLKTPTDKISFYKAYGHMDLSQVFAAYINGCCPNFKEKVLEKNKLELVNFKEGEVIDKNLIELSTKKYKNVEITEDSTLDDYASYFIPIV